jgi:hypothetical protein
VEGEMRKFNEDKHEKYILNRTIVFFFNFINEQTTLATTLYGIFLRKNRNEISQLYYWLNAIKLLEGTQSDEEEKDQQILRLLLLLLVGR